MKSSLLEIKFLIFLFLISWVKKIQTYLRILCKSTYTVLLEIY